MEAYIPQLSLGQVAPFAILICAGLLVLALDALLQVLVKGMTAQRRDQILNLFTGCSLALAGLLFYLDMIGPKGSTFFEGALRVDEFGNLGVLTVIVSALVYVFMAPRTIERLRLPAGELYALLLFAVSGMALLAVSNELITAFVCIEILSLSLYVMAGMDRRSLRGSESAFKYFILGAFASAFLVLGTAFLFGATGTTQLFGDGKLMAQLQTQVATDEIPQLPDDVRNFDFSMDEVLFAGYRVVRAGQPTTRVVDGQERLFFPQVAVHKDLNENWLFLGFTLVFVGLCFKLSLAPFHMWAPDVYQGAPTITAMFIATASKVAAFAFLVHLVEAMSHWVAFPQAALFVIGVVAAVSVIWGNLAALVQSNIKRMLAYSSVAHGGYMAIGVAALVAPTVFGSSQQTAGIREAILLYLFAYTVMNVIAFGIAAYLGREGEDDIRNYRGLSRRRPWLAAGMAIAMISLTGIPPTIGFAGKFFVFKEAIDAGLVELAVLAMVMSAVSAFYYLRVVVAMYMQEEEEGAPVAGAVLVSANGYRFVLTIGTAMVFLFGIFLGLFPALGGG